MGFAESFAVALDALMSNKLRSFLTMLGIIIGVLCITLLISFGEGMQAKFLEEAEAIGSNLIVVIPGKKIVREQGMGGRSYSTRVKANRLKPMDAAIIRKNCPSVESAAGMVSGGANFTRLNKDYPGQVEGSTWEYRIVRKPRLQLGTFFSREDSFAGARVAVIGDQVREVLFEDESPIGEKIKINQSSYRVVGVLDKSGPMFGGQDDEKVIIPLKCAQELFDTNLLHAIYATAKTRDEIETAKRQITTVLTARHGGEQDFDFITMQEIMTMITAVLGAMTIFFGLIAAVSLLVGGIGIMNIMLASVTERTKEIGIRKAVGARGGNILVQFLIEATLLAVIGGAVGLGLGYIISAAVTSAYPDDFPTKISLKAVLIATGFSAAVGIFFGVWPARRASRLDPIVALRYE